MAVRSSRRLANSASPAGCIRPAARSASTRPTFRALQMLPDRRGVIRCADPPSTRLRIPSIQPTHRTSSTISSHVTDGSPDAFGRVPIHFSAALAWCSASHSRSSSADSNQPMSWGVRSAMASGYRPARPRPLGRLAPVTRDELILRTRQLIAEGERLDAQPSLTALQTWLQLSDDLLATAWGTMDRYHLSWLMVGKPKGIVRGREMTGDEEAAYVREVAGQKTAALRMSLDAVERQGMPFRGETGGVGAGQGMGEVPASDVADQAKANVAETTRRSIPLDPDMQRRLDDARRAAAEHGDHDDTRHAPRNTRLER